MFVYLIWQVLKGYNWRENYDFMIAGHTKFTPDWSFGWTKKILLYYVLFDVTAAINES